MSLIPLVALLAAGCGKSHPPSTPASTQPLSNQVIVAIHWVGKARLAQDTNAAYQVAIWNMPESVRLEQQTLDKLAHVLPTLLGATASGDTNVFTGLAGIIRPLLDDLVQAESFTEVRAESNRPVELALAIRLSPERAALWQTNVAEVIQVLADRRRPSRRADKADAPETLQFTCTGDWTVLGIKKDGFVASAAASTSPESLPAPDQNAVFTHFVQRFSPTNPLAGDTSNLWLELDIDLSRLVRSNSILPSANLPFVHLTIAGEGQTVRTRAELTFPKTLELKLEPWQVPTNLIHDPLVSFTAIRDVKSWIESCSVWQDSPGGDAPNQLYAWAIGQIPSQSYFAAVWPDSSNRFRMMADRFAQNLNPRLATNHLGKMSWATNANRIAWTENPFSQPFLQHEIGPLGEIVLGGFSANAPAGPPLPEALLAQFVRQTNVLYYDWEITDRQVMGWLYLVQFLRFATDKAQLATGSAGLEWLQAVGPKLGNAATVVHQIAPTRLTVSRTSSVGFTGIELQVLMDWLESPEFPRGLHTFTALPPPRPGLKRGLSAPASGSPTNAPPVQPAGGP